MVTQGLTEGSLVVPKVATKLFSSLFKTSADGNVFSPEIGPYTWEPPEIAVVIDVFQMPFDNKRLHRVLLNRGGVGWTWEDMIILL